MSTAIPLLSLCASYDMLWVTFTFTSLTKVRRISVFRRPVPIERDKIPSTTDGRYPSAVLITNHVSVMGSDPTAKIKLTSAQLHFALKVILNAWASQSQTCDLNFSTKSDEMNCRGQQNLNFRRVQASCVVKLPRQLPC